MLKVLNRERTRRVIETFLSEMTIWKSTEAFENVITIPMQKKGNTKDNTKTVVSFYSAFLEKSCFRVQAL